MKKSFVLLFAALCLAGQILVGAQDDPRPFNSLAESVAKAIKEEFPDWERTPVPPINKDEPGKFSDEIIIDQWKSDKAIVKVSILIHPSREAAAEALKKFTTGMRSSSPSPDLGAESYVWGIGKSVAFRKGRYTVYVSTVPVVFTDYKAPMDRGALQKEMHYNKAFAKIVAKTLKDN